MGELWRGAKGFIASAGLTADSVFTVHFMYNRAFPLAKPGVIAQLSHWQLACLIFCGLNTLVGYAPGGSDGSLAGSAGERDHHAHPTVYAVFFRSFITGLAYFFARPMSNLLGYRCVCRGCGRDDSAIGHRIWGGLRKHTTVVSQPRAGE
ncbi:hypothetical protein ACVXG9_25745 [Escherichia coli]